MSGAFVQDITGEFPLGPCKVIFSNNNLGHTDESTKATCKVSIVEAMAAKYGKSGVGYFVNGQEVEVDFTLLQNDMTILAAALPFATQVSDLAGDSKLTFGKIAGQKLPIGTLALIPENGTNNPKMLNVSWTMQASPVGDFEFVYDGGKIAGVKCKFKSVINESGASDGSYLGTFGDPTITSDTTELTATVVPAEGATGVTGAVVTWTFSTALAGQTVTPNGVSGPSTTFTVVENPGVAGTVILPGTVALINNGASTTVVWTSTGGNFTASKTYVAIASGAVSDQNGNLLENGAGLATYFET